MADANGLVQTIKRAAVEAVDAAKPVNVYFGKVESVSPLKINVEQKMSLGEPQLILTRNVTDFSTTVTVDWQTEDALSASHQHDLSGTTLGGGDPDHNHGLSGSTGATTLEHAHGVVGKKQITIHNALTIGDQVILLRQQEGQKFVVIDRIGGSKL